MIHNYTYKELKDESKVFLDLCADEETTLKRLDASYRAWLFVYLNTELVTEIQENEAEALMSIISDEYHETYRYILFSKRVTQ